MPMKEKIEIADDRVRLLRLTPSGEWAAEIEMELKAFMDLLAVELPQPWENHPILPPECRWYGHRQRMEVVVVEEAPRTRLLRFSARTRRRGDEAPQEFYELAFPYVVFGFLFSQRDFEEMKVFYRREPLASMSDELYLSNLFNVQLSLGHRAQNRACLRPKPEVRDLPIHEQIQRLIGHFWNTEFNLDIEDNGFAFYASRDPELAELSDWQEKSLSDPLFVLDYAWEPAGMNLSQLIGFLMNQYPSGHWLPYTSRNLGDLCYAIQSAGKERPEFDHREGVWRK